MPRIAGRPELERVTEMLGIRRPPNDALRAKLMGRLASLRELLRDTASVEAATAAVGWAALMLTGASRCAVFLRLPNGAMSCPWSHLLSDAYVGRLCTPAGPNSWSHLSHHLELACMDLAVRGRARNAAPSIVEDICALPVDNEARRAAADEGIRAFCSWPLGRGGRVFGALVYFFDTPHACGDQEREVVLAFALLASTTLDRALAAEARIQMAAQQSAESDSGALPEVAAGETPGGVPPAGMTELEIETETARLVMLRRVIEGEAARLEAERTALRAEREQLATARRELDAERERLAEVRRACDAEQQGLAPTRSAETADALEAAGELEVACGTVAGPHTVGDAAPPWAAPKPVEWHAPSAADSPRPTKTRAVGRAHLEAVDLYQDRVTRWAEATAGALRCSVNDVSEIREAAALLYDIEASSRSGMPVSVAAILRHLEEHWDGTGRPDGLAGNAIPLGARLLVVTLAYAEMVIGRPGSPMLYHVDAKAALRRDAGTRFDPVVVTAFCGAVDRT